MELEDVVELIQMVVDTEEELVLDTNFDEIPGWDSVNAMRLFNQLEKEAGFSIPLKPYLESKTVSDVYQLLNTGG